MTEIPDPLARAPREEGERLRYMLWRCLWVQAHVYEAHRCREIDEEERERIFELAVEEQKKLTERAEFLGFEGKDDWLHEYALALLRVERDRQLADLEIGDAAGERAP